MNKEYTTSEEVLRLAEFLINMAKSDPEINDYELEVKVFAPAQQFWDEFKTSSYCVHTGEKTISITLKRPRDSNQKIMGKMIACLEENIQ